MLRNAQELFRSEIRLAKTEIQEEATRAASSALWLAAGSVVVLSSWSFLLWTAAYALSAVMAMWAATLVIALITATVGAIAIGVGVRRMKRVAPVPDRTIDSLKENLEWIKQPTK
jgi:cytochrome bd-type quinol oxidase subunit 2